MTGTLESVARLGHGQRTITVRDHDGAQHQFTFSEKQWLQVTGQLVLTI